MIVLRLRVFRMNRVIGVRYKRVGVWCKWHKTQWVFFSRARRWEVSRRDAKAQRVLTSRLQIGTSGGYCDDGGEVFDLYGEEFGL